MAFTFKSLTIPGIILIETKVIGDKRGYFAEMYKFSEFEAAGIKERFIQQNQSKSQKGVLRGLHFQKHPKAQGKLIRAIAGEIFDVVVDLRKGSPTYGKWVAEILSEANKRLLYVPVGFAHGFCVLSDMAEILYSCTEEYSPQDEGGLIWNDPAVAISWPIKEPIVSTRDQNLPELTKVEHNFVYTPVK
jgi:dTDP-4-dehydrorhamnose 3,5-epimerase